MSDTLVVGLLTFSGTVVAGVLAFLQWRHVQVREERKDYRQDRVEALRIVWEAVSDAESKLRLRMKQTRQGSFPPEEDLLPVNLLLLRHAPFLLEDEREWTASFMGHLVEVDTLIRASDDPRDLDWFVTSMIRPRSEGVVARAATKMRDAGDRLSERYAAVVRGDHE